MKLFAMVGYKLYKELEDGSIHMVRIVNVRKPYKVDKNTKDPSEISIYDYSTKETKKVKVETLHDYTPLKPDGILSFNIVNVVDQETKEINKDVMVTAVKYQNVELGLAKIPYVVCRQSITDIFYNLSVINMDKDMMVGLSVSQDTCPTNFDFRTMMACSNVIFSEIINFYRNDILEDIYPMIRLPKYDSILENLFLSHAKATGNPTISLKKHDKGWCRDLKTLLIQNNFQYDINQMLGITGVDFEIAPYLEERPIPGKEDTKYLIAGKDLHDWLCQVYRLNINEAAVIEFDHDINLADFNNARYFLFRDNKNKLYLIVYTLGIEKFEADLEAKYNEMDFSTKFKLAYFNKY